MIRIAVCGALLGTLCGSVTAVDDPATDGPAWVARYIKLGGDAAYYPNSGDMIQIDKFAKDSPPVTGAGQAAVPKVALCGPQVTDDDVVAVLKWKGLKELHILDCKNVTDVGVGAIAKVGMLSTLTLEETAVTGKGIAAFSRSKTLTHLKVVNIEVKGGVTELVLNDLPALKSLVLACPEMKAVSLSKMPKLTDLSPFSLKTETADLSALPGLDSLDFRGCRLNRLTIDKLPGLKEIDLRKTDLSTDKVEALQKSLPDVCIRR